MAVTRAPCLLVLVTMCSTVSIAPTRVVAEPTTSWANSMPALAAGPIAWWGAERGHHRNLAAPLLHSVNVSTVSSFLGQLGDGFAEARQACIENSVDGKTLVRLQHSDWRLADSDWRVYTTETARSVLAEGDGDDGEGKPVSDGRQRRVARRYVHIGRGGMGALSNRAFAAQRGLTLNGVAGRQ